MVWCMLSLFAGAIIFASGILFERSFYEVEEEESEEAFPYSETMSEKAQKQWEELLNYDGNGKENENE